MREGNFPAAAEAARRYWSESRDNDAVRLVAVAHLLAGRYGAALDAYNSAKPSIEH
jgi:hypothetical protein